MLPLLSKKIVKFLKSYSIPFSECWCCSCVSLKHDTSLLIGLKSFLMPHACFENDLKFSEIHIFSIFSNVDTSAEQKNSLWLMMAQISPHKNVYHKLKLYLILCTSAIVQVILASLNQNLQHFLQGLNLVFCVWYMPMTA